jgi:hypothetical protein
VSGAINAGRPSLSLSRVSHSCAIAKLCDVFPCLMDLGHHYLARNRRRITAPWRRNVMRKARAWTCVRDARAIMHDSIRSSLSASAILDVGRPRPLHILHSFIHITAMAGIGGGARAHANVTSKSKIPKSKVKRSLTNSKCKSHNNNTNNSKCKMQKSKHDNGKWIISNF